MNWAIECVVFVASFLLGVGVICYSMSRLEELDRWWPWYAFTTCLILGGTIPILIPALIGSWLIG